MHTWTQTRMGRVAGVYVCARQYLYIFRKMRTYGHIARKRLISKVNMMSTYMSTVDGWTYKSV